MAVSVRDHRADVRVRGRQPNTLASEIECLLQELFVSGVVGHVENSCVDLLGIIIRLT